MANETEIIKGNRLLVVLSAIAFFSSVAALIAYDRYFAKKADAPDDVVAQVEYVSPIIKHRSSNRFAFHDISASSPIGNGDYIFSGEGSQIILKFNKGPRIVIGEKSMISLRQNEGTPQLKVESGAFSGTFEESESVEVVTEGDLVTLNGQLESQFAVSYLPGIGLEISSFDHELELEYNGKSASIKNQTAKVSQKRGIEVKGKPGSNDGNSGGKVEPQAKLQMPKGLEVDETLGEPTGLTAPYPKAHQIFFHTKGGRIPLLPKSACSGPCEVRLLINGAEAMVKLFNREMAPLIFLKVAPGMEAEIKWEFSDGGQKTEGVFEIRSNNKDNFQKAFANQYPVEVMN